MAKDYSIGTRVIHDSTVSTIVDRVLWAGDPEFIYYVKHDGEGEDATYQVNEWDIHPVRTISEVASDQNA